MRCRFVKRVTDCDPRYVKHKHQGSWTVEAPRYGVMPSVNSKFVGWNTSPMMYDDPTFTDSTQSGKQYENYKALCHEKKWWRCINWLSSTLTFLKANVVA
jgi:hypothetical protein